ncbi:2-hydroxychromene-2-carboxylate isomerase [Aestuariivita boseongensis]|uniref:2-hydroxychromene-2-carboxylate isomerase n=1 Tax=Aestuariivita boseongensis TaxID=1470562 RepID=UPI00068373FD|nr:2-hydroxychromene-2-carboxylate isomerase [Aestuariivita boseongensis]
MTKPLEFWFEFASTYSYPAALQVEEACKAVGVPLIWKPFLLGPVFAAQGMTDSPFNMFPVKGTYMWRDLERICGDAGLGWTQPTGFPRGSVLAGRIAARNADAGWVGDFVRAVYTANFAQDRDIADDAVIADILSEIGQDPEAVIADATSPEGKVHLRANTEEAQEKGLFGAPSMRVGDELFWGHDRLAQAIAWAQKS